MSWCLGSMPTPDLQTALLHASMPLLVIFQRRQPTKFALNARLNDLVLKLKDALGTHHVVSVKSPHSNSAGHSLIKVFSEALIELNSHPSHHFCLPCEKGSRTTMNFRQISLEMSVPH